MPIKKSTNNPSSNPTTKPALKPITKEKIISELQAAARKLGHVPTSVEFNRLSGINYRRVYRRFSTYCAAVSAAGLVPNQGGLRVETPTLLQDWGRVVRKLGFVPTTKEYVREGSYSTFVLRRRFNGWTQIPAAFKKFAESGGLLGNWSDVLEKIQRGPIPAQGCARVLKEWRAAAKLGFPFARRSVDYEEPASRMAMSRALPRPLVNKKCVTVTMLAVLFAGTTTLSALFPRRALSDRPMLGAPMSVPGLAHEPLNEMGVILLFGLVARELGFIVESVRAAFPDCEAKMEVEPGKWQRVRIEFEYESLGFRDHKHDPEKCDLIVCWRHNWKACPANLQVLELSRVLQQGA